MLMDNIWTSRSLTITEMFSLYKNNSCNSFLDYKTGYFWCWREKIYRNLCCFGSKTLNWFEKLPSCFFFFFLVFYDTMLADVSIACVLWWQTHSLGFWYWNISSSYSLLLLFPDDIFKSSHRKCCIILSPHKIRLSWKEREGINKEWLVSFFFMFFMSF